MSEENKTVTKDETKLTEEIVNDALTMFFSGDKSLSGTKLSRGAVIRALRFALHSELTTKDIKLQSKDEIVLAFVVKKMLDSRLILQAKQRIDLDNKTNEGEENVENT